MKMNDTFRTDDFIMFKNRNVINLVVTLNWDGIKNITNIVLFVGSLLISGKAISQTTPDTLRLTLSECVGLLVENNQKIKFAQQSISIKEAEERVARGLYFPQIGINANAALLSKSVNLDLAPVGDALAGLYRLSAGQLQLLGVTNPPLQLTTQYQQLLQGALHGLEAVEHGEWNKTLLDDRVGKVDAQFTWPIFTGGKIRAANRAAKAALSETEAKYWAVVNSELVTLINVYHGLQLSIEVSKVRSQVVDALKIHYAEAQKLVENGMISDIERMSAMVALTDAEREYQKSVNDIELLQTVLKNLLNIEALVLPKEDLILEAEAKTMNDFIIDAKRYNPVFQQIESKKVMADQLVSKELSKFFPDIALVGNYDIYRYNMSDLTPEWYVGLGLRMNIFDGLAKSNSLQAAKIQRDQIETFKSKTEQDIEKGVTQLYLSMTQQLARIATLEKSFTLAQELVRMRQKSFAEGMSTSTQVVDVNLNLARVRTERLQAVYEYNVVRTRLLELTGTLHNNLSISSK